MDTKISAGLVSNAAQCRKCGEVVESLYPRDYVTCSCGGLSVDGGLEYAKRTSTLPDGLTHIKGRSYVGYKDLCVFVEDGHEVVREVFKRGSYGKDGDLPLHWIKLKDMTDEHLTNTIEWNVNHGQTLYQEIYLTEIRYRRQHGISVQ